MTTLVKSADFDFDAVLEALEKDHGDSEGGVPEEHLIELGDDEESPPAPEGASPDSAVMFHLEEPQGDQGDSAKDQGEVAIELFDDPEEAIESFQEDKEDAEGGEDSEGDDSYEEALHLLDDMQDDLSDLDLPPDLLPGAQNLMVRPKEEERETSWSEDNDHAKFLPYLVDKLRKIPPHSGQTTVGCEKAISYLRKLDKEISKAIQSDEKNVIDEKKAEELRDRIHSYVDQLEEAYDELMEYKGRKKKKASVSIEKNLVVRIKRGSPEYYLQVEKNGEPTLLRMNVILPSKEEIQASKSEEPLTKEAGALVMTVDPFLQSITRLLIRSSITQGKNIEDVYNQLHAQYDFTPREQLSIHEVLLQKGMPLNVDLGRIMEKDPSPFDGRNVEYATEYYS